MGRTYVTGLWIVENNAKHSPNHYYRNLPTMFALLRGNRLVFHYNDEVVMEKAEDLAKEYQIALEPIRVPVQGLDGWRWADQFVNSCEAMRLDEFSKVDEFALEKGVVHFWRDLREGGYDTYLRMLAVWLSKVPLVAAVARRETTESLAWVDASVARFNGKRENWNFPRIESVPGRISHYGSQMRFYGQLLPLNASYLEGDSTAWCSLERLFIDAVPRAVRMPYGHDEETVLGECVAQAPDLFHCIGHPLPLQSQSLRHLMLKVFPAFLVKK